MPMFEKIGYIVVLYWTCKLSKYIISQIYQAYYSTKIDLNTLGSWAVVTGCSQGIGRAYTESLANIGINIVLVSSENEKLQNLAKAIESVYKVQTKAIELDFSHGSDAYKLIEKETIGLEIGILINNFGMSHPHPEYFLDLPHKDKIYMNIVQSNIVVVTNMCQIILPQMVSRGKGVIVNVSSSSAVIPSPLMTVFAATKAYVLKFSKDLHIEYKKHGIVVQCLLPGNITNSSSLATSACSWMIPSADKYVESAVKTIGKEQVTTGFLPHRIFIAILRTFYKLSPNLVSIGMTRIMEENRNHALRKYVT